MAPLVTTQSTSLPVNPREFATVGDVAYFVAEDDVHGEELWVTDGTPKGTRLVKDINPGMTEYFDENDNLVQEPAGSGIGSIMAFGGNALFLTDTRGEGFGMGLWTSDGTDEGTFALAEGLDGAGGLVRFGDAVYFFAPEPNANAALWKWDGVGEGIVLVNSGLDAPLSLTAFGGRLFFVGIDTVDEAGNPIYGLFATDGAGGTPELIRQFPFNPGPASDAWSSQPRVIGATETTLFLRHNDGQTGVELWKSDGTEGGTQLVKDIDPGTSTSTYTYEDESGEMVTETNTYVESSFPDFLTSIGGGVALLNAGTTKNGFELWRTDGTSGGTVLVKDLAPGVVKYQNSSGQSFSYPESSEPAGFTPFKGVTYFTTLGGSLWKTDGTAKGTTVVRNLALKTRDIPGDEGFFAPAPAVLNGRLLYGAFDKKSKNSELWVSDGSGAGTMKLQDLPPAVKLVEGPAAGTYGAGQSLTFVVNFTDAVTVTGKPQVALTVGKSTKQAVYVGGTGTNALTFRYTVAVGDADADGIVVSKLTGSVSSAASGKIKALLSLPPLDTAGVRVDALAPAVKSVVVAPPGSKTYLAGETIAFLVSFTEAVKVTGVPQIAVTFGATVRQAVYVSGDGTDVLRFEVVVQPGDAAPKGIKLATAIVTPADAGIADAWGNAPKKLSFKAPSTSGVKVNGASLPT